MEYIASRPYELPVDPAGLKREFFFNLWSVKFWPYNEVESGDILYWYWSAGKIIVWKSRIVDIDRFQYQSKESLQLRLEERFGLFDPGQEYFTQATDGGYCLVFRVEAIRRLALPKPDRLRFPQLGWSRIGSPEVEAWIRSAPEAA